MRYLILSLLLLTVCEPTTYSMSVSEKEEVKQWEHCQSLCHKNYGTELYRVVTQTGACVCH